MRETLGCKCQFWLMGEGSLAKSEAFLAPGQSSFRDVQLAACRGAGPGFFCEEKRHAWPLPTRYGNGSRVSTHRIAEAAASIAVGRFSTVAPRYCAGSRSFASG